MGENQFDRAPLSITFTGVGRRDPRCTLEWRKCVGVEPTERRSPDAPLALKARRVTGPYSLPM